MQEEEIDSVKNSDENVTQEIDNSGKEQDQGLMQFLAVVKELFAIVKNYALYFVIPVILMGLYGYYEGKKVKPTYTAKITFFLSEERPQVPGFGGGNFSNLLQTTNSAFANPKKLKEYAALSGISENEVVHLLKK